VFPGFIDKVFLHACFEGARQRHNSVLRPLAVVDDDGSLAEIDVIDPQPEGLHEAEAGAIHELDAEFPRIFQMRENRLNLVAGQDDGWSALGVAGDRFFQGEIGLAKDLAGEEDHCVERLFLGGCGHVAFQREVAEGNYSGHLT